MADPKLDGIAQTVFAKRERLKRDFDMGVEQFALLGQTDPSGTAPEKFTVHAFFQLLDRFADRRLADIEFFGGF